MQKRKFGTIRARDCQQISVRIPPAVRRRIEATTGQSAAQWLTAIALTMQGGSTNGKATNRAKA